MPNLNNHLLALGEFLLMSKERLFLGVWTRFRLERYENNKIFRKRLF